MGAEQPGAVAQVFLQPAHLHVGPRAGVQQRLHQPGLRDVGTAGLVLLVAVGFEGQAVQLAADVSAAGVEPFGQAGLGVGAAVGPGARLHALPGVEQHRYRLVVQRLALLGQGAARLGVQLGDQRQQQRALGQFAQARIAADIVGQ